ncbi:hypothetical protein E1B28_013052 [Marasmius oreades]|uniref:Uncharacterized protein n=1 Tax=Marasmius oreades TaxID=181124 RepID=A0A9P7RPS9_9AGAR|nr:uncharacterized protein E1B28_013052 [Marasmius oreades]KAG7087070.1 hypothetical protein E1B28_013052 [Marasmius oreades]
MARLEVPPSASSSKFQLPSHRRPEPPSGDDELENLRLISFPSSEIPTSTISLFNETPTRRLHFGPYAPLPLQGIQVDQCERRRTDRKAAAVEKKTTNLVRKTVDILFRTRSKGDSAGERVHSQKRCRTPFQARKRALPRP